MQTSDNSESIHVCHCCQFAARAIVDDLTANPDLLNIPAYKELTERVYMAGMQSAQLAKVLGDDETAKFTYNVCGKIVQIAEL